MTTQQSAHEDIPGDDQQIHIIDHSDEIDNNADIIEAGYQAYRIAVHMNCSNVQLEQIMSMAADIIENDEDLYPEEAASRAYSIVMDVTEDESDDDVSDDPNAD